MGWNHNTKKPNISRSLDREREQVARMPERGHCGISVFLVWPSSDVIGHSQVAQCSRKKLCTWQLNLYQYMTEMKGLFP